jgi:protease IV
VLDIRIGGDGTVPQPPRDAIEQLMADDPSAIDVLAKLDNAQRDGAVQAVLLRMEGLSFGWARAAELRQAIVRLREQGKKVFVFFDGADDLMMFVASAADQVWLSPAGGLSVDGVRGNLTYVADALAHIGIEAEAVSAGKYKSAPRTFTHNSPSDEELEVENAILDGVFGTLTSAISEGRAIELEELTRLIDQGGLTATEAMTAKLVDDLVYVDELEKKVEAAMGGAVLLRDDVWTVPRVSSWGSAPQIALIPVVGTINMGYTAPGLGDLLNGPGVGAQDFIDAVDEAVEDDDIKAIVIRIDSPGGDALASDLMWRAVMRARAEKPVVVSMGDYAASGGYYIASAGQHIFAQPDTLTGSIGVFSLLFNAEDLATRLGVSNVEISRGERPGPTLLRGLTASERTRMQAMVDDTYSRFLSAIVEGRGPDRLTLEQAREHGEGHVWTGLQARDRGLVDELGGLREAITWAKQQAGIADDGAVVVRAMTSGNDVGRFSQLSAMVGAQLMGRADAQTLHAVAGIARALVGDTRAVFWMQQAGRPVFMAPTQFVVR